MRTIIAIMIILASIAFGIASHLISDNRRHIAYTYLSIAIGLSCLAIALILINAFRKPKRVQLRKLQHAKGDEKRAFGVYWDSDLNPLCPVCKTPLTLSRDKLIYRIDGGVPLPLPEPHCFKCNKVLPLHDDDGNHITIGEAKKLLSPKKPESELEAPKPPSPQIQSETPKPKEQSNKPSRGSDLDDIAIEILKYIALSEQPDPVDFFSRKLDMRRVEIQYRVDELIQHGYIRYDWLAPVRGYTPYSITPEGRKYLVENNLLGKERKPEEPAKPKTSDDDNKPVYKAPHPDSSSGLNEIEIKILVLLASPDSHPFESWIAIALQLHLTRVQFHLTELRKKGYISSNAFHSLSGELVNELTQKARAFLIDNNLID